MTKVYVITRAIRLLMIASLIFLATGVNGQDRFWSAISRVDIARTADLPVKYHAVSPDIKTIEGFIRNVPHENEVRVNRSGHIFSLPMPDGSIQRFKIVESPVMEEKLALKYPDIKTFSGQGIDDPTATMRFSYTAWGLQAMIISSQGFTFIEPVVRGNTSQYISYLQKDMPVPADLKFCGLVTDNFAGTPPGQAQAKMSGANLRTYRLAVSAAGEYTDINGGTVPLALAALTAVVNQVTLIYEREVAIRFVLVNNNDQIIYTDSTTDPFTDVNTNPCSSNIRAENQTSVDNVIGADNYDIGHVFSGTNIGGCAAGAVVCGANKAWGHSGVRTGTAFDIGLTAHEMGHQFSAAHTFNSNIGSCLGGQYQAGSAYEPGSGTTIMSYAGTCHDLQGFRDMLFHTWSYEQIIDFSTGGGGNSCPVITATGNTPPTVNAGAGGLTIPINTPFTLTGSGNDADGDALVYSWEQFDLGPQGHPNTPSGSAPIFRSFPPVASASRTFPQWSDILSNTQTMGEILPSYTRDLNFRLTARDNRANGGGVEYASVNIKVDESSGPFRVTSPNTNVTWCPGDQTVTWDVANTNVEPVDVKNVNILLSTDGGLTYPITLISNTPNDGSQVVSFPCVKSTQARVRVEAVGNIFFDVSNVNFTTGDNTAPTFTAPSDITLYKDATCSYDAGTAITGDVTDESDNCSSGLNATFADSYPAPSCDGETIISRTWTLTDGCGNSTQKIQTITVRDTTRPTFTVPADAEIYKDANCEYDANTGITGDVIDEADNCDNSLDAVYEDVVEPGSCMGEEIISRTWTLTDDCGNSNSQVQVITARDTTRPDIDNIYATPSTLWPPDHSMRDVYIGYVATDNCSDAAHITNVLTVTSNEPVNGSGDGNTSPDWIVIDEHNIKLRAERAGNRSGRIYTITITSTDDCGNVATATVLVRVAHDQSARMIYPGFAGVEEISVYPNPSNSHFTLELNKAAAADSRILISDISGRVLSEQKVTGRIMQVGEGLRAGVYILKVLQGNAVSDIKLIKL